MYGEENYETLEGADALLKRPEQRLFRRPDFPRMKDLLKTPLIFDGRNQYSPPAMKSMGFEYVASDGGEFKCGPGEGALGLAFSHVFSFNELPA